MVAKIATGEIEEQRVDRGRSLGGRKGGAQSVWLFVWGGLGPPLDVALRSTMNASFPIIAALMAECLAGATVIAQPSDLPLSKTSLEAGVEMRQAIPRRFESLASPVLQGLEEQELGFWHIHCGKDELTGETTSCFLYSPAYMPVGWKLDSSCTRGRQLESAAVCATTTLGDTTLRSQRLTVFCDGQVNTGPLFTASRFMVGDEVVTRAVRNVAEIQRDIEATRDTDDARALASCRT